MNAGEVIGTVFVIGTSALLWLLWLFLVLMVSGRVWRTRLLGRFFQRAWAGPTHRASEKEGGESIS